MRGTFTYRRLARNSFAFRDQTTVEFDGFRGIRGLRYERRHLRETAGTVMRGRSARSVRQRNRSRC